MARPIKCLYKTELFRRPGPSPHVDAVEHASLEWIDSFNHRRFLEPISDVQPADFEMAYYRQQQESAMAA